MVTAYLEEDVPVTFAMDSVMAKPIAIQAK